VVELLLQVFKFQQQLLGLIRREFRADLVAAVQ
jgi:hypothetical protein